MFNSDPIIPAVSGTAPAADIPTTAATVLRLRQQVAELTQEVADLRSRVEALEPHEYPPEWATTAKRDDGVAGRGTAP